MRNFRLPENLKRFWVFGVLLLALLLFAGGLYFRHQSLLTSQQLIGRKEKEEGVVSGVRTNLPADFPSDIPLFEPAETLSTLKSQERLQLTLQTNTNPERVLEFYRQKMKDWGWRLTERSLANDSGILTFTKDGRQTQLIITSESNGSTLIILSIIP